MYIKHLLLTLVIVSISFTLNAPIRIVDITEKIEMYNKVQKENKYFKLYKESLNILKEFEGFSLTSYTDVNGKSIGYGHHIQKYEKIPNIITEEYAEILLRVDFEHAISTVEQLTEFNRFNNPEKVLALAHFVYNLGSGNFANSTLLQNIKNDKCIESEIIKWTKMKVGNNIVHSNHLYKRRLYELTLYQNG